MEKEDPRSVQERLAVGGYTVTDRKYRGVENGKRMIVDKDGNDVGFLTPLEALKKFNL